MKPFILLLLITISTSSCYHVYYAPNTAHAPLLNEKGETRINALYAKGGDSGYDGGELQFAHAVGKNVGIMINGFSAGTSEQVSSSNSGNTHLEKGNGSYIEVATGVFKNLSANKKWVGELYGGAGFGSVTNVYGFGDRSKVKDTKLFLQPAIGFKSRYFEFAVVPKVGVLYWQVKERKVTSTENNDINDDLTFINRNKSNLLFEPAFIIRGGGEEFKIQAGLSFSNFHTYNVLFRNSLTESLNASLGISINMKSKKKDNN